MLLAVLAGASCAPIPSAGQASDRQRAGCESIREVLRSKIAADLSTCQVDEDCEPVPAFAVGSCEVSSSASFDGCVPTNPGFRAPGSAAQAASCERVVDACWALGDTAPVCPVRVGVCVAGRCQVRKAAVSPEKCQAALADLKTEAAGIQNPCTVEEECIDLTAGVANVDPIAASAATRGALRKAVREVEAYCPKGPSGRPGETHVGCAGGRCALLQGRANPSPKAQKPRLQDSGCIARVIRIPATTPLPFHTTVRFAVSRSGKPVLFHFLGKEKLNAETAEAIVQGVMQCSWVPGQSPDGEALFNWVILPIRFE